MSDLREKLSNVQQELKAPKNLRNSFAGFDYRNCEGILEAVKPLLKKEGLLLTLSDEVVNIGNANYVKAQAWITTVHDEDNGIYVSAYAREEESLKGQIAAQITGGASSYARKYALNGLFNIDDSQDPDSQDHTKEKVVTDSPKTAKQVSTKFATDKQIKLIFDKLRDRGIESKENAVHYLNSEFGIPDITKVTMEDASILIEELMGS